MSSVGDLIATLRKLPPDLPVHVWTAEEEFDEIAVLVAPSGRADGPFAVCRIEGR